MLLYLQLGLGYKEETDMIVGVGRTEKVRLLRVDWRSRMWCVFASGFLTHTMSVCVV